MLKLWIRHRRKARRFSVGLFAFALVIFLSALPTITGPPPPVLDSPSYLLMDPDTGKVIYGRNINAVRAPASTTKIMTALLAIESGQLDSIATISARPQREAGSKIGISAGEKIPLKDLTCAMMIRSGNDAAVAIAEFLDGSISEFSNHMNRRAQELGMKDTYFMNPNGMPDDRHQSSAFDLALLAREAMQHEEFRQWVKMKEVSYPVFGNRKDVKFVTTNHLLEQYYLADGIKTGYTDLAGFCLVASATYKEKTLIAVVLGCERNRQWPQAIQLFDYGFSLYDPDYPAFREVMDKNTVF